MSVEIQDTQLIVHALDGDASILDELRSLEEAVAALFGMDISASAATGEALYA